MRLLCPSVHVSISPPDVWSVGHITCLSIQLSSQSVCSSVRLPFCPSVNLPVRLSALVFAWTWSFSVGLLALLLACALSALSYHFLSASEQMTDVLYLPLSARLSVGLSSSYLFCVSGRAFAYTVEACVRLDSCDSSASS